MTASPSASDYLALLEGKLFDTDTSIGAVLEKLAAEADSRGAEFVNLFYGSDVSEEDAQKAGEQFGRLCPGAEINVVSGGQPVLTISFRWNKHKVEQEERPRPFLCYITPESRHSMVFAWRYSSCENASRSCCKQGSSVSCEARR